jgi:hypothetical protein
MATSSHLFLQDSCILMTATLMDTTMTTTTTTPMIPQSEGYSYMQVMGAHQEQGCGDLSGQNRSILPQPHHYDLLHGLHPHSLHSPHCKCKSVEGKWATARMNRREDDAQLLKMKPW